MKKSIFLSAAFMIALMVLNVSSIDKATMERGKKVYTQYCISCHQVDGGGVPGFNPPLEKTSYISGSKTRLIRIILKGMNTHEDIDGETYSNTMPPLDYLKDQQISDVLTYVRNCFGNQATAVSFGDVKYVRARTK
jgi:mono/diheme cytochrome c family protein